MPHRYKMGKLNILVLALILSSAVHGALRPTYACKGDIKALMEYCAAYVVITGPPVPPSAACCKAIQGCDIPCICKTYVTPEVEKLISMKKLVYIANKCHRPFAHKSKCGHYTVPAAYSSGA